MATGLVIGAGPNGLAAAITLARAGVRVTVVERNGWAGGACSTREVTLPGFWHDLGSGVYPMGVASPFFGSLEERIPWVEPEAACAHPLDDGTAVMLEHSVGATAEGLDDCDRAAYRGSLGPIAESFAELAEDILGPVVHVPRHPLVLARFGVPALMPAATLARAKFKGVRARALFAGMAAHSVLPLEAPTSAAVGLVLLAAGHARGWPIVSGGAQALTDVLVRELEGLGGRVELDSEVEELRLERSRWWLAKYKYGDSGFARMTDMEEGNAGFARMTDVGRARGNEAGERFDVVMGDVTPRQMVRIAGESLTGPYRRGLERFRYGAGAFKIDYALSEAIPWRAKECGRAATVHLGGTLEEVEASEREFRSERPFCLLVQPSLFDETRAPTRRHTAWVYCHVPNGWMGDCLEKIERQIERFAPGFRECVLARKVWGPAALESWNANLVGGDLGGGAMTPGQLVFRPTVREYATPVKGLWLCGASTPPGGGVHGMCGWNAAVRALREVAPREFRR